LKEKDVNMDFNEILKIVKADDGKFIIIENGKPTMVVLSFEDYRKKIDNNLRKLPEELEEEPLKIEDLPFE